MQKYYHENLERHSEFLWQEEQEVNTNHPCALDGEGFEPSVPIKAHTLSKRAHSTTLPPIRFNLNASA